MRIQNNVPALNAHRFYTNNNTSMVKSMAKLSSGYRINSAADDAAGLAISEKMRAQIRGLNMASRNAQDAVSLIQTAEGGLQQIGDMVQNIRELVAYASNDTHEHNAFGTGDRQKIQDEINQLTQEIDSLADRVEFNKKKLINGSLAGVPENANDLISDLNEKKAELKVAQAKYSIAQKDFKDSAIGAQNARDAFFSIFTDPEISKFLQEISKYSDHEDVNTTVNAIMTAINGLRMSTELATTLSAITGDQAVTAQLYEIDVEGVEDAIKTLQDLVAQLDPGTGPYNALASAAIDGLIGILGDGTTDGALDDAFETLEENYTAYEEKNKEMIDANTNLNEARTNLALSQAKYNAAPKTMGGLYFQVGANANQGVQLYIGSVKSDWLAIGDGNGVSTISVLNDTGANVTAQLDTLDMALSYVTTERSKLGAAQNRMESTIASLEVSAENLTAAESRIRDVDMAKEMSNFTRQNILFQASTAMLAQANAMPQGVLQLLG